MWGYFSIGLIDFLLKGTSLTDFTNLFWPPKFERNDKVILNYFLKLNISMNDPHAYDTKKMPLQLDNPLQFGLSRIKKIQDFFTAEINQKR